MIRVPLRVISSQLPLKNMRFNPFKNWWHYFHHRKLKRARNNFRNHYQAWSEEWGTCEDGGSYQYRKNSTGTVGTGWYCFLSTSTNLVRNLELLVGTGTEKQFQFRYQSYRPVRTSVLETFFLDNKIKIWKLHWLQDFAPKIPNFSAWPGDDRRL